MCSWKVLQCEVGSRLRAGRAEGTLKARPRGCSQHVMLQNTQGLLEEQELGSGILELSGPPNLREQCLPHLCGCMGVAMGLTKDKSHTQVLSSRAAFWAVWGPRAHVPPLPSLLPGSLH